MAVGEFLLLEARMPAGPHAIALRYTLVTNNVRHLAKVPGLSVENWA